MEKVLSKSDPHGKSETKSPYFTKNKKQLSEKCIAKLPSKQKWIPPRSPYNLIQEDLYHDPWKLLVATIFLNKTKAKLATPVIWNFFKKYPSAEVVCKTAVEEIEKLIESLGLKVKRASILKKFSEEYLYKKWTHPSQLCGIGKYGSDSYNIFCINQWKNVRPRDTMLNAYVAWLWENHGNYEQSNMQ